MFLFKKLLLGQELVLDLAIAYDELQSHRDPNKGLTEDNPHVAGVWNNENNEENFTKQFNETRGERRQLFAHTL